VAKSLPSDVLFASLLVYSPRGKSEISKKSQDLCQGLKRGDAELLRRAIATLKKHFDAHGFGEFLGPEVGLVPAPRSAPRVERGLWPAELIAHALVAAGYGKEVLPYLKRTHAVPKSAFAPLGQRPTFERHCETIQVDAQLIVPARITIVDDVVTKGRTLFACAQKLRESYPNVDVRCFAIVRTMGLQPDVERIAEPCRGRIYWAGSDVDREP
jgi:predicted amidophosphoribosyltransferase